MPKFRKKPVVIEAWRNYTGDPVIDGVPGLAMPSPVWLDEAVANGTVTRPHGHALLVHTLEGVMTAYVGDWIIRGIKGELYPCRADIFAATYEPAED